MGTQLLVVGLLLLVLCLLASVLYWRVPAKTSYIRDGVGKKRVMLEKGGLVIPGVHKLSAMDLSNFSVTVAAIRERSLFTSDPVRVNVEVRLLARIKPDNESILIAQGVFDGEVENIHGVLKERCHSVLSTVASEFSLKNLLSDPTAFELRLNDALPASLADLGLEVVLCSIISLRQTGQMDYQRSNSLDAQALAMLESMRMESMQKIHTKFMETQLQMKQLDFKAAMMQLQWEEEFAVAKLEHQRHTAEMEAHLTQEIKEIEVSKQVALEMLEQDAQAVRLQQYAA